MNAILIGTVNYFYRKPWKPARKKLKKDHLVKPNVEEGIASDEPEKKSLTLS